MTLLEASPPSQGSSRELGLRVQAGFSAGEVRRLLEAWGATPEELDGDASTLAHRLVSLGQKRFGSAEMTRRLKAEKPLIEWPEDGPASEKWAGPRSGLEPDPTLLDAPVAEDGPSEQPSPAAAPPEPEKPAQPAASSNPMILLEPEAMRERPAGTDNLRYLVIGGAGLLVLTALAFGAGLAWNRGPAAEQAEASAKAGPPPILARRAGSQIDEGLLAVALLCDLEVTGSPTRDVLEVAQGACAEKGKTPSRRPRRPELDEEPQSRRDDRDDDEPARSRPASVRPEPARPRRDEPAPSDQPAGRGSCNKTCMRVQEACVAECGPEPTNASLYDAYLACTGKCITASSRCRTSCP